MNLTALFGTRRLVIQIHSPRPLMHGRGERQPPPYRCSIMRRNAVQQASDLVSSLKAMPPQSNTV